MTGRRGLAGGILELHALAEEMTRKEARYIARVATQIDHKVPAARMWGPDCEGRGGDGPAVVAELPSVAVGLIVGLVEQLHVGSSSGKSRLNDVPFGELQNLMQVFHWRTHWFVPWSGSQGPFCLFDYTIRSSHYPPTVLRCPAEAEGAVWVWAGLHHSLPLRRGQAGGRPGGP